MSSLAQFPEATESDILETGEEEFPMIEKKPKVKRVVEKELMPAIVRLYRFLYTGTEDGLYVAGVWNTGTYYKAENVTCIPEMLTNIEQAKLLIEAVKFVKPKYPRTEPCLFTLALAIKSTDSDVIKGLLYMAACDVISTCDEFFVFIDHLSSLKSGTGAGWRRFVAAWYKSIPPNELAAMVGCSKAGSGWTHKDVLRLAHEVKLPENYVALRTVLCYLIKGLPAAVEKFGKEETATEVLAALQIAERVKLCQDPAVLLSLVGQHRTIGTRALAECSLAKDVGGAVWKLLLERIPIEEVLSNVQKLHNAALLVPHQGFENPETKNLVDLLKHKREIEDVSEKLVQVLDRAATAPPLLTYIVLCDYEAGNKRLNAVKVAHHTKAKKAKLSMCYNSCLSVKCMTKWEKVKRKGEIMPPKPEVSAALRSLLSRSLSLKAEQSRVQGRYLVSLDLRDHMFKDFQASRMKATTAEATDKTLEELKTSPIHKNHCFWNSNVVPGNAAVLLALYFSSHVAEVTVAVFTDEGLECVSLEKDDKSLLSMEDALLKLKSMPLGHASLASPVEWALAKGRQFDLFVNVLRTPAVVTRLPKDRRAVGANPHPVLCRYQEEMGLPHAGIVNISLGRLSNVRLDYNKKRILDIFGLDEHIPDLVHAFAHDACDKL